MNKYQKLTADLLKEYYEIYEMLAHCVKIADSGAYALNNAFGYLSEEHVLDLFNKSKQDLKNLIIANTNICTHLNTLSKKLEKIEKTNPEFELKHSSKIANFTNVQRHFVLTLKKQDELLSKMKNPIQTFNSDVNYEEINTNSFDYRKVVSIASPFKERIINLIYHNEGRIGVPNLNKLNWWIDEE